MQYTQIPPEAPTDRGLPDRDITTHNESGSSNVDDSYDSSAPTVIVLEPLLSDWPNKGEIEIQNLYVRHRQVLSNLSNRSI